MFWTKIVTQKFSDNLSYLCVIYRPDMQHFFQGEGQREREKERDREIERGERERVFLYKIELLT
jgi:hypothetical protein